MGFMDGLWCGVPFPRRVTELTSSPEPRRGGPIPGLRRQESSGGHPRHGAGGRVMPTIVPVAFGARDGHDPHITIDTPHPDCRTSLGQVRTRRMAHEESDLP